MNEKETSKDIIAEMRTKAECAKPYDDGIVMMLTDYADRFEAALKREQSQSWHHREMEELVLRHEKELVDAKKSSGDAAKLREASGNALWCLNWMYENTGDQAVKDHLAKPIEILAAALAAPATTQKSSAVGDCAKLREALATIRKRLVAAYKSEADFMRYSPNKPLVDLIDAALAAPPRNCDRFATETDAQIAFLNEVWLIGVSNLDRDPFDGWTNEMKSSYSKWLLAPATEKEEGAS